MKKIQLFLFILFLTACSSHEVKMGGSQAYQNEEFSDESKLEMAEKVIKTSYRDYPKDNYKKLFIAPEGSLKKIGVMFFETVIQGTPGGLSTQMNYYLTAKGKQIYTEKLYQEWMTKLASLRPEIDFVDLEAFANDKQFKPYTSDFVDHIAVAGKGEELGVDDVQYLVKGKSTTMSRMMMPRKMKDISVLSAPASTFLVDSKPSDFHKYWLSDVAESLGLDAIIAVYVETEWNVESYDAIEKKTKPEGAKLTLQSAVLVPYKRYKALRKLNNLSEEINQLTIPYRAYSTETFIPLRITGPTEKQDPREAFVNSVWFSISKTYASLSDLMIALMKRDLKETL